MGRFSTELSNAIRVRSGAGGGAGGDVLAGVSTRKAKAINEELCSQSFSASSISDMNQRLNERLAQLAGRPLVEAESRMDVRDVANPTSRIGGRQ
jgi:hypothetical protein